MSLRRTVVLASASPARLALLRGAGIEPVVRVSEVDEPALEAAMAADGRTDPAAVCLALAAAKAAAVADAVRGELTDPVVVGADSVLDLAGVALGKPRDAADATQRWREMAGRTGWLRTGHAVVDGATGRTRQVVASTLVRFGTPDEDEVAAYVRTGEPLRVAGAFTLDGLGGAFVDGVDGDPSNVVGLSLPVLRSMLRDLGIRWTDLWTGTG